MCPQDGEIFKSKGSLILQQALPCTTFRNHQSKFRIGDLHGGLSQLSHYQQATARQDLGASAEIRCLVKKLWLQTIHQLETTRTFGEMGLARCQVGSSGPASGDTYPQDHVIPAPGYTILRDHVISAEHICPRTGLLPSQSSNNQIFYTSAKGPKIQDCLPIEGNKSVIQEDLLGA